MSEQVNLVHCCRQYTTNIDVKVVSEVVSDSGFMSILKAPHL